MKNYTFLNNHFLANLFFFFIVLNLANAQEKPKVHIDEPQFLSIGYETSNAYPKNRTTPAVYHGPRISLYYENNWLISFSYKMSNCFKSENFPSGYKKGIGAIRADEIDVITVGVGKRVADNKLNPSNKYLRVTYECGISWIKYREATFTRVKKDYSTIIGYTVSVLNASHSRSLARRKVTVGLNFKTKIELNFGRGIGSGIIIEGNINTFRSFVSFGTFIHFGKLRDQVR